MKILIACDNKTQEWNDACYGTKVSPRLPLPYSFTKAFLNRGHTINGVNFDEDRLALSYPPFSRNYGRKEFREAINAVDVALLWGGVGVRGVWLNNLSRNKKIVILCSFYWDAGKSFNLKREIASFLLKQSSRYAQALVVMTMEQKLSAERFLKRKVPIIKLQCGIDTQFYSSRSSFLDVPTEYQPQSDALLKRPYVIMMGDQERLNQSAIKFVLKTGMPLVRICYHGNSREIKSLREQVAKKKIEDRFYIFSRISYVFVRFLLQNASAYVGFVDSGWQPAGWTVACEALASGVPIVMYKGIVSRELERLGANEDFMLSAEMGDDGFFMSSVNRFVNSKDREVLALKAKGFAATKLNLEITGNQFARDVESLR